MGMPVHDYDAAIQAKNTQKAKENVTVSNYQEHPVMLPDSAIPIGLDVSFDMTQKYLNYSAVYLGIVPDDNISVMDCVSTGNDSGIYNNENHALKWAGKTSVHYRCLPRFVWLQDEAWLHQEKRDHICFRPHLLTEMLVVNLKEYNDYRKPTAEIGVGLNGGFFSAPTQNIPIITDLLTRIMPPDARLRDMHFWQGIIHQSLQPDALTKAGYSRCFSDDDHAGWLIECYCRN